LTDPPLPSPGQPFAITTALCILAASITVEPAAESGPLPPLGVPSDPIVAEAPNGAPKSTHGVSEFTLAISFSSVHPCVRLIHWFGQTASGGDMVAGYAGAWQSIRVAIWALLLQMSHGESWHMAVDVQTDIEIDRPRAVVAAYASDPDNATAWYQNIKSVEWKSSKPLAVGSRITFVAQFLGRTLSYTYEVRDLVPDERFIQSTAEGPFPMETTNTWDDTAAGGTKMKLRNRGDPTGFSQLMAPLMASAMRRADKKDLARLKAILETANQPRP
jgi:uncharacterized membrane protein